MHNVRYMICQAKTVSQRSCVQKEFENPFMPSALFYFIVFWTVLLSNRSGDSKVFIIAIFIAIPVFNVNSVELDLGLTVCQCPFLRTPGINGLSMEQRILRIVVAFRQHMLKHRIYPKY